MTPGESNNEWYQYYCSNSMSLIISMNSKGMVSLSVQNGAYIHSIYAKQSDAQSMNSKGMVSLSVQNGAYIHSIYAKQSDAQSMNSKGMGSLSA